MRAKFLSTASLLALFPLLAAVLISVPPALAADGAYAIVDRWKIGGEGGWDYLLADPSARAMP